MSKCLLCPNLCGTNRASAVGKCRSRDKVKIAKYYLHKYEEPIICGDKGSGTVFFTGCSLKCVFCQNYEVSRSLRGKEITVSELANIFLELEQAGARNINLVNPTHYSDKIIEALEIYKPNIPILYNSHGYERLEILRNIDKYIDIYLPDVKYFSPVLSKKYSGVANYFEVASKAIEFMANKPLKFDSEGYMLSGCIVRHLILPLCVSDSKKLLDWFNAIKDKAYINLMSQYTPFGEVTAYPEINRKITAREYQSVLDYAISLGIDKAFYQDFKSQTEDYIPQWDY